MSRAPSAAGSEQSQPSLFSEGELPAGQGLAAQPNAGAGEPRLLRAQRNQVELRPYDLDALLAADHAVRSVWAFVQALDLAPLYAAIKSVRGSAGAPATDPAILVALWLWASIDGVGSAREVARLCERDDAYRWICGGVGVNHHSLSDVRTQHAAWLDAQLTRSMAALMERKLVTLNIVAHDGMRVRAAAKAASLRRRERLQRLHELAQAQLHALKAELHEDAGASSRRKQAAQERAAREREQRLAQALATMDKIERLPPLKKKDKKAKGRDDDGPPPPTASSGVEPAPKPEAQLRVSTTDPEARVMKMADGGFRPAFNAQFVVDAPTQFIAAVGVTNSGSDMGQMAPMHQQLVQRYGHVPQHWLADGGFTKLQAIEELHAQGTQAVVPPPRSRNPAINPFAPKDSDSAALAQWRSLMGSDEGKALYRQRGATVECANAQLRRRGLQQFNVRGLLKAHAVLLWHALAHNLMRMRSLGIAFAAN